MSDTKTLPEKAKTVRLDFGQDDTPLRDVFGTKRITLSEMQIRLWDHIESKKILVEVASGK